MENLSIKQSPKLKTSLKFNLKNRIELTETLQLEEKKIAQKIHDMESSPLFKRLACYGNTKIISRNKFHFSGITKGLLELNECAIKDTSTIDIETFIEERKPILPLVKKMGQNNFSKYFLFLEDDFLSAMEIAERCCISIDEVEKIRDFINEFCIKTEFFEEQTSAAIQINFQCVAEISNEHNGLSIKYISLNPARGSYIVDYDRFEEIKNEKLFTKSELIEINELLRQLELINVRRSVMQEILQTILDIQSQYLKTGDPLRLVQMNQKELAGRLKVHPSMVNRAITDRSVILPWKEEKALKELIPNKKTIAKICIKNIIAEERERVSDELLKKLLTEKYGIITSRRSIASHRKEMKLPSTFKRQQNSTGSTRG